MTFDNFYLDCIVKIASSFLCGLLLGLERKSRQHTVGMRTLVLISISSSILCMLSIKNSMIPGVPTGDPNRITAGIVTGIGFLGGGAILHHGLNIRGLTTAAIVLMAMALGVACGAGQFFIAGFSLILVLTSLLILEKIEWKLFPAEKTKTLTLIYTDASFDFEKIKEIIKNSGVMIKDSNMEEAVEEHTFIFRFSVKASGDFDLLSLSEKLKTNPALKKISLSEI